MDATLAVTAVLTALVASAVAPLALLPLARRAGLVDVPVSRSSHRHPVPRGGGIGVVSALVLGVGVVTTGSSADLREVLVVAGAAVALGVLGLADDLAEVSVGARSALQLLLGAAVAAALVVETGATWAWVPLGAVALAAAVNVTNFFDGVDGITAVQGCVVGVAYAWAGAMAGPAWVVAGGLLLAASCLGFLPWNLAPWPAGRARLFLGDAGSYGIGAATAVLAGGAYLSGVPVEACLAPLVVPVADCAHTLVLRAAAGQPWHLPHRTHAYQRLTDAGWSHARVTAWAGACTAMCSALGLVSLTGTYTLRAAATAGVVAVAALYLKLPAWLGHPSPWGALARREPA